MVVGDNVHSAQSPANRIHWLISLVSSAHKEKNIQLLKSSIYYKLEV